jgi:hypothetical protein
MLQKPSSCVLASLKAPTDWLRYDLASASSPRQLRPPTSSPRQARGLSLSKAVESGLSLPEAVEPCLSRY